MLAANLLSAVLVTTALASRLAAAGRVVTANVVAPGLVVDTEFFGDRMTDQRLQRLVGETFTGRAGTPADVAATIRFLSTSQAGHLTGQVVHVNGGAYLSR